MAQAAKIISAALTPSQLRQEAPRLKSCTTPSPHPRPEHGMAETYLRGASAGVRASAGETRSMHPHQHHHRLDPYAILGVSRGASRHEIKQAYRRLALRYHPDVCRDEPSGPEFQRIHAAYEKIVNRSRPAPREDQPAWNAAACYHQMSHAAGERESCDDLYSPPGHGNGNGNGNGNCSCYCYINGTCYCNRTHHSNSRHSSNSKSASRWEDW